MTASPDDTVQAVAELLRSANVGSAVVTEEDEPVGLLTDRDIALSIADDSDVASLPVSEVMTHDPVTLREDAESTGISRTIGEVHVRWIPIVDDDGKLTGIVTLDDFVVTIGERLHDEANAIESHSPTYSP